MASQWALHSTKQHLAALIKTNLIIKTSLIIKTRLIIRTRLTTLRLNNRPQTTQGLTNKLVTKLAKVSLGVKVLSATTILHRPVL